MRKTLVLVALVGAIVGTSNFSFGQNADGAQEQGVNSAQYIKMLVGQVGNDDPRIRYSIREALRVMGKQSVGALNAAKASQTNPHVKAFIERSVKYLKARTATRGNRGERGQRGQRGNRRGGNRRGGFGSQGADVDRIAMDANLKWEQIAKLQPVLKSVKKDMDDLMAEFREAGGFRDREAWADLREEMKAIAAEAEPKLKEFLEPKQIEKVKRQLNPMGNRMGRMMRGRGGRGGGERGRRERPERRERP